MDESKKRVWKGFPLNWEEISLNDNETDKFRPLTEFQSAILLQAVAHYRYGTRWLNLGITADELDEQISEIQDRLMREDGIGGDMATKEDIRDGIYEAANRIALQIATGQYANIGLSTDADGIVTPTPEGSDAGLPEDDPATTIDETAGSKAGGAIAVRSGFNEIWSTVSARFVAGDSAADAFVRLAELYLWEDSAFLTDFVNDYWAARTAAESFVAAFTTVLDSYIYCKGNTKNVLADWIYDTFTNASTLDMARFLRKAIAQEQMDLWFEFGSQTPSTAYVGYTCYPAKVEEFTLDMSTANNVQYTTNAVYKASHRLLVEVSGSFVDSDVANTVQDYFYTVNTLTGAKTFLPAQFQINGAGITEPTQAQVPYEPSHVYAVTVDIPPTSSGTVIFGRDNDTFTTPNVVGFLTFKITDLGEYAL